MINVFLDLKLVVGSGEQDKCLFIDSELVFGYSERDK